jgi:hypothetical protein
MMKSRNEGPAHSHGRVQRAVSWDCVSPGVVRERPRHEKLKEKGNPGLVLLMAIQLPLALVVGQMARLIQAPLAP